jgi:hypothetical protein
LSLLEYILCSHCSFLYYFHHYASSLLLCLFFLFFFSHLLFLFSISLLSPVLYQFTYSIPTRYFFLSCHRTSQLKVDLFLCIPEVADANLRPKIFRFSFSAPPGKCWYSTFK